MKNTFLICLLLFSGYMQGQTTLSGQIVDAITEQPIKSALIHVPHKVTYHEVSDKKGKFKIKNIHPEDTLTFIAAGYASVAAPVGNAKKLKVVLFPLDKNNSVDIGYGSQDAKSVTSSVYVLSSNDFNKVVTADIYSYLRGKIPGLQIIQNGSNGMTRPKIMLRGTGSLTGSYEPLIVIDGIQNASLDNLDPNDVASVTVLKDGSAQAIYGSQASGGVILIKTKR